eukprot:TRINITY_DN628_c0_g1_i1.p1 TRINITY_DN628_c0_g1~~TRINITY_DN628_c0_g1_i1.p1  ORF type:complete len:551 (-),score=157.60 TRINITY_DN628_c0_g1_i1:239-1891(-)
MYTKFVRSFASKPAYQFKPLFQNDTNPVKTEYKKLEGDYVSTINVSGQKVLKVKRDALKDLAFNAMFDVSHLLRPSHLQQVAKIMKDPEASANDRFVADQFLKNACIAAGRQLPTCQDTGTATVIGKRGKFVWSEGEDEAALSEGICKTYTEKNLRYSQTAPLDMFKEVNTNNNMPAQIDIYGTEGNQYKFLFMAKGGGSANKTMLYQQTKALLNPTSLSSFLKDKIKYLGTAACPPYHVGVTIGGMSADQTLKTAKLASARYYDGLPTNGDKAGRAFRDVEWEEKLTKMAHELGIGAQFGGKYFVHDIRVIRLPRHGASCPVGIAVSCSADRQILAKITEEGVFLEKLETDPAKYMPDLVPGEEMPVVNIDLNQPMTKIRQQLSQHPVSTLFALNGTLIVARDIAHAKLKERLDAGKGLPDYVKKHPIYYAGPAKTPSGMASGSFGPTTAGRMDSYADLFMQNGGSFVTVAKGNRSQQVTDACKKHGGFYLGSIGGPAAVLAKNCIKKVELLEYPELGMEAIYKIEVENFPAICLVDDKGNDFFSKWHL